MRQATLTDFVAKECGNYCRGTCHWGACTVLADKDICRVSWQTLLGGGSETTGDDYFQRCVLPLAKQKPEYTDAAYEYESRLGLRKPGTPTTRKCECGEVVAKGCRLCQACAKKRRKEAWRARRLKALQKSPNPPL